MHVYVATVEKKTEERGEQGGKNNFSKEKDDLAQTLTWLKLFRLQEECRYAAIHNWRTPTDCLAPSSCNCSKAWKEKKNMVVPSKEWHK